MNNRIKKYTALSSLLTAATISVTNASSIPSPMDESSRKAKPEIYGIAEYFTNWEMIELYDGELSLKMDSGWGGGVGLGFNFNEYLNLNMTFVGASLDFKTENSVLDENDTTVVQGNFNLDYNILKKRLTPLLTVGAGLTHFSNDFGDNSWFNYGERNFSWGFGGGVRWDISDDWFMKAIYRVNWTNVENSDNTTRFNSIALGVGYVF